jgi:phage terminase large subunit GpA-like protein
LIGAIASYVANEPTTLLALESDRSTLLSRQFGGGSLKIVAARAPRNLRRHSVRVLLADEVDAMELPTEGDARDFTVSDLEPLFQATPAVATALSANDDFGV